MAFLRKADGPYVPGNIDAGLAGYFLSATVKADGSPSGRRLAYPARHHAYFILTFLRYYAYTGEREWLLRARDLADWNIANSTRADVAVPFLPYSTWSNGKPGGHQDQNSLEPDKAAFLGNAYLALYEATAESRYLDAARRMAATLVKHQRPDGGWAFRVVPEDGNVLQELGGAPVFFVEFFERMDRHGRDPAFRKAGEKALRYMLETNVRKNWWGTYHEDVGPKEPTYLSAESVCFTAAYLFRQARAHLEYAQMGLSVLRPMEERLVHTEKHAAAPAPAVSEQPSCDHIMPGHTARYCLALAELYGLTGDDQVRRRALSGLNGTTYMQAPQGIFRTWIYDVKQQSVGKERPDWYSQHLYTVCHALEMMMHLPELVPAGEDHLIGSTVAIRSIDYGRHHVQFETGFPSLTVLKLSFEPTVVQSGDVKLRRVDQLGTEQGCWAFESKTGLLRVNHAAGAVEILGSAS
ncbi:MAG: hypothetical protein AMXMBFR13_48840 [Phycisphaerae bacterium]